MKPCISQATTMSTGFEADLEAYARGGFGAVEIWLTKLETYLATHALDDARRLFETHKIAPVAAASQGGLLLSRGEERAAHWSLFERRLELLQALGVPVLVVVADFLHEPAGEDFGRAARSLADAGARAGERGVRLALEFQKSSKFCASLDTTLAFAAQSAAENVGICLDFFHYYTGPSKFEDFAYLTADQLAWVQISDLSGTPRELAGDADRILPGDGDFQIDAILDQLQGIGYNGYVSLEVLNPQLWQVAADRVADFGFQSVSRALGSRASADAARGGL